MKKIDQFSSTSEARSDRSGLGFATYSWDILGKLEPAITNLMENFGLELEKQDYETPLRLRMITFHGIVATHFQATSVTIRWVPDFDKAQDQYLVIFVNRGLVEVTTDDESYLAISRGGSICIVFPGCADVKVQVDDESELLLFGFHKREIVPIQLSPKFVRDLPANSAVFRSAYIYLAGLVQSPEVVSSTSANILRLLTREVARAIALESTSDSQDHNLPDRAYQMIVQNFRDPDLNADSIATQLGVSRRSLDRAHQDEPRSVAEEIRFRRTQFAFSLLAEQPSLSVSAVAAASGFKSAEVMRRSLVRQYGQSAAEIKLLRVDQISVDSQVRTADR